MSSINICSNYGLTDIHMNNITKCDVPYGAVKTIKYTVEELSREIESGNVIYRGIKLKSIDHLKEMMEAGK